MAATSWLGRANATYHVSTHVVGGTAANGQVYSITINGKTISYTATGVDTNSTIATALQVLLAASTITEFAEITWTVGTATITGTGDTAGQEHVITSAATGTGTLVTTTTTTPSGPNNANDANNWSAAAVLTNGDVVTIAQPVGITAGLDQSAVTLTAMTVMSSFTGSGVRIGRPRTNATGSYTEFRNTYLKVGVTTLKIGVGEGAGPSNVNINLGSVQTTCEVRKTGQSADANTPSVLLLGTHASNSLDVQSGTVGVGYFGEASTLDYLRLASNARVICGEGCTLGDIHGAGILTISSAADLLSQTGGDWTVNGTGAVAQITQTGGILRWNSSGTVTAATIGGTLDLSGDATPKTFTDLTLSAKGSIYDPLGVLTVTNKIGKATGIERITAS